MGSTSNNPRRRMRSHSAPEKPRSAPEKLPAAGANDELEKKLERRRRWEQSDSQLQETD